MHYRTCLYHSSIFLLLKLDARRPKGKKYVWLVESICKDVLERVIPVYHTRASAIFSLLFLVEKLDGQLAFSYISTLSASPPLTEWIVSIIIFAFSLN